MSCISRNYNPKVGPLIDVCVSDNYRPVSEPFRIYQGLIDTGANGTCISINIIKDLKLKEEGRALMLSATEKRECRTFRTILFFPFHLLEKDFLFPVLSLEGNFEAKPYDILIGTDIISKGFFCIGSNNFTFCF